MKITQSQFDSYYKCQMSGVTNMFMVSTVMEITGLTKEQCLDIMENYSKYAEEYGYK